MAGGGNAPSQCVDGESSECAAGEDGETSATFIQDGYYWYVEMDGKRTSLGKDLVKDFMSV